MTLTNDAEKKITLSIKAIRDVGFPIVVACFLIYFGTNWADRLLTSQETFVAEISGNYKDQTRIMKQLFDISTAQSESTTLIIKGQDNLIKVVATQTRILEEIAKKNGITVNRESN